MNAARWDMAARRVWRGRGVWAGSARALLLPLGLLYRAGMWARNAAYDAAALPAALLPVPSAGVGNLSLGGAGKTPFAAFVARELARRGMRSAVLLRGYGRDEAAEYATLAPGTIVAADADRQAAARSAVGRGATALVLDDCLQRRDVIVDVMFALVAAESWRGERWPFPAGPWREGPTALERADAVVITRKAASERAALAVAAELAPRTAGRAIVAELAPASLRPLGGGPGEPVASLRGRDVLAVCGVGAPDSFAAQLAAHGARVELLAFGDHHPYGAADVAAITARARTRLVVTTGKDAVKLAALWPPGGPPAVVAALDVRITHGWAVLDSLLERVAQAAPGIPPTEAAAAPLHRV